MVAQSIQVIPGIFEKDFETIKNKVSLVSSYVGWIQIDIADGEFVPNTSFLDPEPFRQLTCGNNKFELHMMVEEPFTIADQWIQAGFKRVILHYGSLKIKNYELRITNKTQRINKQIINEIKNRIHELQNQGVEVGIAIDKDDPIEGIIPFINDIDCVLVMTIKAGFSGQAFMPDLLDKIRWMQKNYPQLPVEVDGGINEETAKKAIDAGATRLVSTSYLFNSPDVKKAIWKLKQ